MPQRTKMAVAFGAVFGAGTAVRAVAPQYQAVDLGLAGSLLAGLTGGYWTGLLSGVLISIPAMLRGEWMTMPMLAGFGLLGGLLRDLAPEPEEIWRFSPVFDLLAGYRFFRREADLTRSGYQLLFLCTVLFAVFANEAASTIFTARVLVAVTPSSAPLSVLGYATMVLCVALPLKIWNSARTERKLEDQDSLLVQARLTALTNQINPHFLFNTLNSIASLVRVNPEEARGTIYRLSNILRRLLRKAEAMTPLRDELRFIDDYLSIEMVRFGDKLRYEQDIDPATLNMLVPSMILQPLVENSIKHGLANRISGGRILIRSVRHDGRVLITVEDDGEGIAEDRLARIFEPSDDKGIGIGNVNERLRVLFGDNYRMAIDSRPQEGTRTEIDLPDVAPGARKEPLSRHDPEPSTPAVPPATP